MSLRITKVLRYKLYLEAQKTGWWGVSLFICCTQWRNEGFQSQAAGSSLLAKSRGLADWEKEKREVRNGPLGISGMIEKGEENGFRNERK